MTALLLSEIFPPKVGGSGRWFWEVYRRLPRDRFVIGAGEDPAQEGFDATHDLRLQRFPLSFPTRFVRWSSLPHYRNALSQLRGVVHREGARWLHAGRCLPEGLLALFLKRRDRVPYLCYAHGEEVNLSNSAVCPPWHRRRVYDSRELAWIVGRVLGNASLVIANSQNTREILTRRWRLPEKKVPVLHPGVDIERFRPAPRDETVRHELEWSRRRVILTVGRLQKRKGQDMLIAALPEIRSRIPQVLYCVVGDGEERSNLRRLVRDHGLQDHVQFRESVGDEELIRCYQQCDLFVLPNRQIGGDVEGFGMVLLEAQACGRPVVAGESGGTSETMRIPDTGLVVPCDGPGAVARLVAELLADSERLERMGSAAREWVTARFDWGALSRQAEALFGSAAAR